MTTNTSNSKPTCPNCEELLPPNAPMGLCPRCLVGQAAFAMDESHDESQAPSTESSNEEREATIGRYKVLQKIGEGGFGMVYMAEQQEPVIRKVALKIIKLGMDTRGVVARFEAERQAMAMMDHPNIARVFDAGATDSGRPYFVMELVKGIPITDFCDENQLTSEERLRLFLKVCSAIQHAHQKGIIHRDLKPSNILVMLHEGDQPMPKVIDFGIAKALEHRLTEKTLFTEFRQMIGTPAYMSPEQAQFTGLDTDTRSDVYSMGVLLYELLTGRTPLDQRELLASGYDEVCRRIREEEAPAPSRRWSTLSPIERTSMSKARRSSPDAFSRSLKGDLDRIVMKALEKDRRRRYDTANDLAMDVRRHLNDEPITAVPPSLPYKFMKFARRHKASLATGTAIVGLLIFGIIVSARFAIESDRMREQADELRHLAEAQKDRAIENELGARRLQYAADMQLVQTALTRKDEGTAKTLLEMHLPLPDQVDIRGWEWRFLQSQLHDDALLSNRDASQEIDNLSVSPDERLVAVGRASGAIEVFDSFTLKKRHTVQQAWTGTGPGDPPSMVAFVPGQRLLATSGHEKPVIKLWDTETWKLRREIAYPATDQSVFGLRCSPFGTWLAMVTRTGSVRVLSLETEQTVIFHERIHAIWDAIDFSPDGRWFASGGKQLIVTDLQTDRKQHHSIQLGQRIDHIAFSPNGSVLAASLRSSVQLLSTDSLDPMETLSAGDEGEIGHMLFMKNGTALTAANGQELLIWDLSSQEIVKTLRGSSSRLLGMGSLANGNHLVTGSLDGTLARWNLSSPEPPDRQRILPGIRKIVSFDGPNGSWLTIDEEGAIVLIDGTHLEPSEPQGSLGDEIGHYAWSPHQQTLATEQIDANGERKIAIWAKDRGIFRTLNPAHGTTKCLTFHQQGSLLIQVVNSNPSILAWDTNTWERADERIPNWNTIRDNFQKERARLGGVNTLTTSPDGTLLAIGTARGYVLWYDLMSGQLRSEEQCHSGYLKELRFSPRGKFAASRSAEIALWQTHPLKRLPPNSSMRASRGFNFSTDETRFVTTGGEQAGLRIWDVRTNRLLLNIDDQDSHRPMEQVGFLPQDQGVYALAGDGLHVWTVPSSE